MRFSFHLAAALSLFGVACGNTYHPEYHPETSVQYTTSNANPVHVQTGQAQPVYVMQQPTQGQPQQPMVLPAAPPPPTPPEGFPW